MEQIEVSTTARLLTTADVAETHAVDKATVLRWVHSGQLRAIRLSPTCYRFAVEDVQAFQASKRGK